MSKKKKENFSIALSELAKNPKEQKARQFTEDIIREAQRQEAISMEYFLTGKLPPKTKKSLPERVERVSKEFLERFTALKDERNKK